MNSKENFTIASLSHFKQLINLANLSSDLVIIANEQLTIQYVSPSAKKNLLFSPEELLNKNFQSIIDESELNKFHDLIKNLDFELAKIQLQLINKKKSIILFETNIQYLHDAESNYKWFLIVLHNLMHDVINNQSIKTVYQIIQQLHNALIIINPTGKIIDANYEARCLYGLTHNELQCINIYDIDKLINTSEKWNVLKQELKSKSNISEEITFLKINGKSIDLEANWQYIEINNQEYYIQFLTRINDRIKNELKIRKTLERQHLLSQIAYIVNTNENFDFKINEALRIIGNYLNICRVLIFQNILNGKAVNCSFEWNNANLAPKRLDLQAIPYSLLTNIKRAFQNQSVIIYDGINTIPDEILPYFLPDPIYSIIIVPLTLNKKEEGFLSFIDHQHQRFWTDREIRFITTFVEIISSAFSHKYTIESLIKSERRFRELAELLPEMVFEAAINGKITFANKHAQILFGFSENDLQKGILFFSIFHSSDRPRVMDNFEKLLTGINIKNEEYLIINREGIAIPVLLYMNIIMQDQLPVGLRAVMVDISEQKKAKNT